MPDPHPLLATDSFDIPGPAGRSGRPYVPRPRLTSLLDRILTVPVTLVHAPAGYGKTAAVASWCLRRKVAAAWLALDASDAGEGRFAARVAAAVEAACARQDNPGAPAARVAAKGGLAGLLATPSPFVGTASGGTDAPAATNLTPAETFVLLDNALTRLRDLAERAGNCVLVIDNWHELQGDARTSSQLAWLADRLPRGAHLVLVARAFPHAGLSRLRLDGELAEIGADDLAFTRAELGLFCQVAGIEATEGQLDFLYGRIGGWEAALHLFEEAFRREYGQPGPRGAVGTDDATDPQNADPFPSDTADAPDIASARLWKTFAQSLYDYVYDELLRHVPGHVQTFLLVCSCLDEINDSLAAEVLLWRAEDVVFCLDTLIDLDLLRETRTDWEGQTCYAMPGAVRRCLRGRGVLRSGYRYKDVMLRACSWYDRHDDFDRAVRCAAAGCEWDAAADVVYRHWRGLFANDDMATLYAWFALLPDSYVEARPKLCVVSALPYLGAGMQEKAFERLHVAKKSLGDKDDGEVVGLYHAISCLCLSFLDAKAAVREANLALKLLPASEEHFRAMAFQVIGTTECFANPASARKHYAQAIAKLQGTGLRSPLCSAYSNASVINACLGMPGSAWDLALKAKHLFPVEEHGRYPMLVTAYLGHAIASFLSNDIPSARENLLWARNHDDPIVSFSSKAILHASLAEMARIEGDVETEHLEASRALSASPAWALRSFPSLAALCSWAQAGLFSMSSIGEDLDAQSPGALVELLRLRALFATRDANLDDQDDAPARLDSLAEGLGGAPLALVSALILQACLLERRGGERERAEAALARAFDVSQEHGIVRPFIDDAAFIQPVWQRLAKADRTSHAARLLQSVSTTAPARNPQDLRSLLSDREFEVLSLVAEGMSGQQIALRLFVTRDTVKKHLGNAYAKLGVHTKMQAVSLLHQAGIL